MPTHRIALLPAAGIGVEVAPAATWVPEAAGQRGALACDRPERDFPPMSEPVHGSAP